MKISATTLLSRIVSIAKGIQQPPVASKQIYEVDEIKSFVRNKNNLIWIVYALNRKTKEVVSYNVGNRTNATLGVVTKTLDLSIAKKIYTDKWRGYKSLICRKIHSTFNRSTNHIERHNLTLRTHLKRLTRRSICFSRSAAVLSAILRIYFWGWFLFVEYSMNVPKVSFVNNWFFIKKLHLCQNFKFLKVLTKQNTTN